MKQYLLKRLKQKSTWLGVVALAAAFEPALGDLGQTMVAAAAAVGLIHVDEER